MTAQRTGPQAKPSLSMSLDLDNLWSYLKIHGDPEWKGLPSYLDLVTATVLPKLAEHGLTITVFVVGQDAARTENHAAIRSIAAAGHEIGNHSFHHDPWLHTYSRAEIDAEISAADEAITALVSGPLRGFRGPGFSLSRDVLEVLVEKGYDFDASTFPTFLGPLARAYYLRQSRSLSPEERLKRRKLFGSWSEGLRPLKPYRWQVQDRTLIEIPVTTIPVLRTPFHLSYLAYLAQRSVGLAMSYLRMAILLCRWTGTQPSFLLHPLDFVGSDRVPGLGFFPGMALATARKLDLFDRVVGCLQQHYRIITMSDHAALVGAPETATRLVPMKRIDSTAD